MSSSRFNIRSKGKPLRVIASKPPSKLQRVAKDVAVLKKAVKKFEYKAFDVNINTTISTTATVQYLNALVNGPLVVNYTGSQYTVKSIQVSFLMQPATSGASAPYTTTGEHVRVALVRYKPSNEVIPTYNGGDNDIYSSGTSMALRALDNRHDFIIMKEWNISFDAGKGWTRSVEFYKKLNLVTQIEEGSTGAAGTDCEQNGYYLVTLGTNAAAGSNSMIMVGTCRFRYTDN